MKKIFLFFVLGLSAATVSFAQDAKSPIIWGVHAGINVAGISDKNSGETVTPFSSKVGFTGGVDVQIRLSSSFFLQPELNFSQLGGKTTSTDGTTTLKYTETFDYLTLPVLFKYKVSNTGLGIYIGPQYGYLLGAKEKAASVSVSTTDIFNKSDLSGIFGAEYYFPCHFGISARYQLGLSNIGKSDYLDSGEKIKNHGFTFTVGYRL